MLNMPLLRGKLEANASLKSFTWFRTGGAAEWLYTAEDEADLSYFLAHLHLDIPVYPIGLGSNLIVRDGGVSGVVVRLGKNFMEATTDGLQVRAGAACPDIKVATTAAKANIAGLAYLRGVPGSIGGALRMNAGAYGVETKDVLIEARGVNRKGEIVTFNNADMGYSYRHSSAPDDVIFTSALFQGIEGTREEIQAEMDKITSSRTATQPVNAKTGGSTFKNPEGGKAWQLIDAAGCRGLKVGDAQVSELHCNFLLNLGNATALDIETLGETVRARVKAQSGVDLHWEIKRIGRA
jgi:UDP-N-acetylmuramate dehydrogenase